MLVKDYRSSSGLFEADKLFLLVFLPSCLANASPDANARSVVLLLSCLANASADHYYITLMCTNLKHLIPAKCVQNITYSHVQGTYMYVKLIVLTIMCRARM